MKVHSTPRVLGYSDISAFMEVAHGYDSAGGDFEGGGCAYTGGYLKTLREVHSQLAEGDFVFSRHALIRMADRNISDLEIRQAGGQATVIEEYPADKYSPSCLLLGFTQAGRPLHIQVSLADTRDLRIVTLYEPNPKEWIGLSKRR